MKQTRGWLHKIAAPICCACMVLVLTGMTTMTATAAMPPLPSWAGESSPVSRYDAPPLPPLPGDEAGLNANGAPSGTDPPASIDDDRTGSANSTNDEASNANSATPSPSGQTVAAATSAASPLEGPPVPLPPVMRLGDAPTPDDGLPPNRPISLNFQHAELSAVLHAFAQFTHLNIVAGERVRGPVTLRLHQVPWRTAFDLLLDVNGLAMERHGNVIWVTSAADLAARSRQRFEAHARAAELEPLASRAFELHYAHAEDLRRLLTGAGNQRALSKRGAAVADARTNLLFVTDLAGRLEQIAELIGKLDRPARQVLIEARIVEGDQGLSRNLGVRLTASANGTNGGNSASGADGGGNSGGSSAARGLHGGQNGALFDLSAGPLAGFEAAQIGISLLAARATRLLDIELSALEAEGRGRVVSSPRVVTADRMKAVVEQGTELPYQAKVAQGVSGVQFRKASLRLEVEPRITPDGQVILDLDVSKDSVGELTAAGPAINTKHVQTRVEIEDGGTVSIGGIDATDDRDDVTRVPLLGKIPILGALFSHRAHRARRTELVVLITPRVIRANRP